MTYLLNVESLKTYFRTHRGLVKAVDGISLHVNKTEKCEQEPWPALILIHDQHYVSCLMVN